jgi:hypothetical protein
MQAVTQNMAPKAGGTSSRYLTFIFEILAAVAVAFFFTWPQYQAVQAGSTQLAADQRTEATLQGEAAAYRASVKALQALDTSPVSSALPATDSTIDLYAYMDTVAKAANVTLTGIQVTDTAAAPSDPSAPQALPSVGSTPAPAASAIPAGIGEAKIHLEVSGTTAQFIQLLSGLQNSLRLIDVQAISIGTASGGKESFSVDALTYYQR